MAESDAMRRERSGYWMSGFTTGPDTIMGILWSAGFIYSASLDATCHPTNNGLSSGADGQKCSPNANWNQSLFESVDGATCIGPQGVFGTTRYWHDPSLTGCAEAFTAYRALPEYTGGSAFTCNCSGSTSDHAYLGGPGGARASLVYLYAFNAATFSTAFAQLFVGTAVDYIDNRLRWWWIAYVLCTVFTLSMCVVGSGGIWIVGCIGSVFTLFFSEVVIPIRASYLERLGHTDGGSSGDIAQSKTGYLGAMRQFSSYVSQLVFVILVSAINFVVTDPALQSTIIAAMAGGWFAISTPYVLLKFGDHPATRKLKEGQSLLNATVSQLFLEFTRLKKYPEAMKLMFASAIMQCGGAAIVQIGPIYMLVFLEMPFLWYNLTLGVLLLIGSPSAALLAWICKNEKLSFRMLWVIDIAFFIVISLVAPLVATTPTVGSWAITVVLAGLLGGTALSWFYSLSWASFVTLIPKGQAGQYSGLHTFVQTIFQPIAPAIYTAVVQSTNLHQVGWAVLLPWCFLGLIAVLCVDFKKGKRDAGRLGEEMKDVIQT